MLCRKESDLSQKTRAQGPAKKGNKNILVMEEYLESFFVINSRNDMSSASLQDNRDYGMSETGCSKNLTTYFGKAKEPVSLLYQLLPLVRAEKVHRHSHTHSPEWMKTLKTSIIVHLIYHDRNPWRYLKTWTLNLVLMILLFEHVIFYFYLNSYSPLNFHKWADHMKLEKMSNPL